MRESYLIEVLFWDLKVRPPAIGRSHVFPERKKHSYYQPGRHLKKK